MKPFMVIREPEAFQLLADETRRKILYLLRVKEMNASQIAAELGVTSQAIYHHIRKLLKGKMIEIAKEERVGHLIESYYRATAEDFLLSHGKTKSETMHDKEQAKEQVTAALKTLNKVGFKLEFDTEQISQIADLRVEVHKCCSDHGEIEDKIWEMDDLDVLPKLMTGEFAQTLLMSDAEFIEQQDRRKKLRELLRSIVKETPLIEVSSH
jgi:DNA-binding transcriptional ArsR family regulator